MRIVVRRETPDGTTRPHEIVVDRYLVTGKAEFCVWGESAFFAKQTAMVLAQAEPWEIKIELLAEEVNNK